MDRDIAIIGISILFPKAETLDALWSGLVCGADFIQEIPQSRKYYTEKYWHYAFPNRPYNIPQAAYIDEIDQFDYSYFRLSKHDADYTDPAHRLFLQTAVRCLEDAGYFSENIKGSDTGVFVGYGGDFDYTQMVAMKDCANMNTHSVGLLASFITSRLSYLYDLKGPAMVVDTSCSSSLVALHSACNSIRAGECTMAIVGGAHLYTVPVLRGGLGVQSSDCRTRSFDDSADGTGSGEGVCAILIKKASEAYKDGDHIYAVIKGSAVVSDGNAAGIASPNLMAQKLTIQKAWEDANIDPCTISYVEAHGTGTRIGDPIELKALSEAFSDYSSNRGFCAVSSIKSNMGHLGYCAGLAGLVKAVLQLKHQTIVSTAHFHKLNKNITLDKSAIYISKENKKWVSKTGKRRCGVSSFGISGTNCHVVLEEADTLKKSTFEKKTYIFCLSSSYRDGLILDIKNMSAFLKTHELQLDSVCYTLATGRMHDAFRLAIIVSTMYELIYKLDKMLENDAALPEGIYITQSAVKINSQTSLIPPNYDIICANYVAGENYDWKKLYPDKVNRVSLPGTTLQTTKCWLSFSDQLTETNDTIGTDNCPFQFFQSLVQDKCQDPILIDHLILLWIFRNQIGNQELQSGDNLYDMGADSITALQILRYINQIYNFNLKPDEFLLYQSVDEVATLIYKYRKETFVEK
ncbi:MAG: hypothetical protein HFE65_08365 [Clostridiales bacterium]|nr:hypothetical protein [Clostridiales bacterium]